MSLSFYLDGLEMKGKWPYRWYLRCAASRICSEQHAAFLCSFLSNFFLNNIIRVEVVQPYSSTERATARQNCCFISSEKPDDL